VPKYLIRASYTPTGMKGLLTEGGTGRRESVGKMVADAGGTLESFHFAFGDDDAYLIVDAPDNVTTAAMSLLVNASGAATSKVTVLMTPEEVDQATRVTFDYTPPGG
jgi:uncharacterized protein with GYD domain